MSVMERLLMCGYTADMARDICNQYEDDAAGLLSLARIVELFHDDMRNSYGRGVSYARRHYVRGHYSRTDATEHLRSQINDMMRETDDDRIKDALRRAMDMMEE